MGEPVLDPIGRWQLHVDRDALQTMILSACSVAFEREIVGIAKLIRQAGKTQVWNWQPLQPEMGLPAGEGHATEADQRLGRQGGQAGMARGGKMAAALQPARPACRIGDANLGRSWHRCRAAQLRRWSSCGPTALAWCEQVAMQLAQAAVQRQLRGGGQTAAVLGLDEGQALTTLLSAGPQLRQGLQQTLELGLRLAKPGLKIHHGQRQCGGSSVQWLQVVTPPELLGAIQVHPGDRAVAAYQRTGHLGRITHRQEQAQGNPQLGGNIQP